MAKQEIKKGLIGARVYCANLNQHIKIEEGQEEKYFKLGLDIFDKKRKPKLQKNDKIEKEQHDDLRHDVEGTDDDNSSGISV